MKRWFLNDFDDFGDDEISSLGPYKPWGWHKECGGDSTSYPRFSGRLLDLKDRKAGGIQFFFDKAAPIVRPDVAIVTVPSHNPSKTVTGIRDLVQRICDDDTRIDATEVLIREKMIPKLAHGGDRSIESHLKTMGVRSPNLIRARKVLLIDDIETSGNSLRAGKQILLANGARAVHCLALGKTTF